MNEITRLLGLQIASEYKLHAAKWNGVANPLDVFLTDQNEWNNWTAWFNGTHDFNRPYVVSLMDFYPERDMWLFGGIFEIHNYNTRPSKDLAGSHAYDISLSNHASNLIGRLKIRLPITRVRNVRLKLEHWLDQMELIEILRQPYTGPGFAGYDRASLIWSDLKSIVKNDRSDWKTALTNMKGVYLITLRDGRQYVGSASGDAGLWSRWSTYANNIHAGNVELKSLFDEFGGQFMVGARFTIIEVWPTRTEDTLILEREEYWKRALSSRQDGLNAN